MNINNLLQLNIIVAFFFPLVMAFLKQDGWSQRVNSILSAIVAAIAAVVTTAADGNLSFAHWGESFVLIFTVAVAAYHGLWKPSGVEPAIQTATSVVRGG